MIHYYLPWELGGCSGRMIKPVGSYFGDGFIADVDIKANAEFIVRACNNHDALVAELKNAKRFIQKYADWALDIHDILSRIDQVLEKARITDGNL